MRDSSQAARLEHAGARRDIDKAAIRISDPYETVAPPPEAAEKSERPDAITTAGQPPSQDPSQDPSQEPNLGALFARFTLG